MFQLNEEQHDALAATKAAKGGILLSDGVPSAGKSHLEPGLVKPRFMSKDVKTVIISAPSNKAS
ncbi:uncharacterized protein Z518_01299 [Rhinocladiella mackenziei CBS 650.93]|uniref:Uncharacterized protein n=1 Tax=Rhinocladiella mackenziei CBS 650.93 TaxID=1442369 RepID=A0A0D2HHQ5_9EURO|nr:uncharacterized protein Z518_01299 [Rhinocladiella mackenziei CBS 650.93]KIX10218.1 hypothetical protein Z518_01299 [Rhinocladiella mackenziei CBS 650.93]